MEEFLKIPCFDYAEYAFIPTSGQGSMQDTTSTSNGDGSGDGNLGAEEGEDNTDDGFYDTSIAVDVGANGKTCS